MAFGNHDIVISQLEREVITTVFGEVHSAIKNHEAIYIDDLIQQVDVNINEYVEDFSDAASGRTTEEIIVEVFERFGVGLDRLMRTSEGAEQ